ncbi:MAG: carboxy terminal-processing peptidase [Verrucomicrobia bacterium]|nr:carboxy terminal-processing peptidase [Verrucomicrobiota bacterium]
MKFRWLVLGLWSVLMLRAAESPAVPITAPAASEPLLISSRYTNALVLSPLATDGDIAKTFAMLLERSHYSRHKFDDEISARFFDRYLEVLDPQRLYFLQSDLEEFAPIKTQLDELILQLGNSSSAYRIFNRFLKRFDQSYALVMEQLRTNQFAFDGNESYQLDRKDAAHPADLAAAEALWRDRLRSEYLAEKLGAGERKDLLAKFRQHLSGATWDALTRHLTNRFSPEKASNLVEFARTRLDAANAAAAAAKPVVVGGGTPDAPVLSPVDQVLRELEGRLDDDQHAEIVKKLTRRYDSSLRNLKQIESDEVLQFWLSALGHAYDPHTDYLGPRELEQFSISMNLALFGIGATLMSEDGYTVIKSLVAGAPAEKSKQIKVEDKIIGVAQGDTEFVDVQGEKLSKVVAQIRGPKGTRVRLLVIPSGADPSVRKIISLVRDEVKLEDSQAKARLVELTYEGRTNRVGVIDLPSFYANFPVAGRRGSGTTTTGDVKKLLRKLIAEGAEGIVLDLRRNGGGSLEEAINLTGLFIKAGPVVQVRNYDGSKQVDESQEEVPLYDGPLAVLTSRFSASASEILSGALQDHDRAVIVGDNASHGKGTVQTVQELGMFLGRTVENPGAAKVTIRKFYRPSGASTQLKGVVPDIILPSVVSYMDVGESSLENALAWDTISPAQFQRLNRVTPILPELSKRSSDRVAADRDFDYVRQDIERFKKVQAEKSVSLNEAERRREIAENKARMEARKKELAARKEHLPTTWEITLKNVDLPGLPAPMTNQVVSAIHKAEEDLAKDEVAAADAAGELTPEARVGLSEDDADEDEPEKGPANDPQLRETERIVLDLLKLSPPRKGFSARSE